MAIPNDNPDLSRQLTDEFAARQWALIQKKHWPGAISTGRLLLMMDPSRSRDQMLNGWACYKGGSQARTISALTRASVMAPIDGWTQYTIATVLFQLGYFSWSELSCRRALSTDFNPAETWFLLARIMRS